MEGVIAHRVTPLIKCMVLFLLIFTAKVLTSRPQENQDSKNSINHAKPSHYVRTFTKYHHRRTIQWNNALGVQDSTNWPLTQDQPRVIGKRSINFKDFIEKPDIPILNQFTGDTAKGNIIGSGEKSPSSKEEERTKFGIFSERDQGFKKKLSTIMTKGQGISCLYKIQSVALSVTPSYEDDSNAQQMAEADTVKTPGPIHNMTLMSGETVQVERCPEPQMFCYTLWHESDAGDATVLGQGCWRASSKQGPAGCDMCRRVAPRLPSTRFCCCTTSYCNNDYLSLQEEVVTPGAVITTPKKPQKSNHTSVVVACILALVAAGVVAVACKRVYCARSDPGKHETSDGLDLEKGDVMGCGPEALATGLLCVDNLTLIEHIGQGKYGSVWRGSLGTSPVAVKLYSNPSAWQREAAIYVMPHLAHPNILRYYGSDTRATLTGGGGREQLIVLELCCCTLRRRLEEAPISWAEYAHLAHGLAAALAHLHTSTATKPCVVHRDVNSNNVLISLDGSARLADLGLAQSVRRTQPGSVTEAGTLRYLAPEALEGALDLSGARAALCAVDVFALGLVLWELVWRTGGAHAGGRAPPYRPPYHQLGLPARPTLAQMQSLVSRKKARPPLPKGPVPEARALKIATDTCDECWDHDAEARLTAVCVEERMSELKLLLHAPSPVIHDNKLHPSPSFPSPPETDKNSNCILSQACDVTTPLLYTQPHIGRNPCQERNTLSQPAHPVELIHKSLKDITVTNVEGPRVQNEEAVLSVARVTHRPVSNENSDRLNEIRSYQRPLDYVQNDVSSHDEVRGPKQTNLLHDVRVEKPKWGLRKFFEKKLQRNPKPLETEVKLVQESLSNSSVDSGRIRTSIISDKPSNVPLHRPSNIVLSSDSRNLYNLEGPCLSPPNRTLSPTMIKESDLNRENKVFGFKEIPQRQGEAETKPQNQIFAVIVPKGVPQDYKRATNLIEMHGTSRGSSESLKNSVRTSMSSQSIFATAGQSESEDSMLKKRLSVDNKILSNSGRSSRASINLELQYIDNQNDYNDDSPFDLNSDCSNSEDEHLMLLSENGGAKITIQTISKTPDLTKNEVLKEATHPKTDFVLNKYQNKYTNFDNEFSDPQDKENLGYGDNPIYLAALNGEIATDLKYLSEESPKSPKPPIKSLSIKRQHSLEHVSEIFSSSGDVHLQNPAGRVKTPGDLPVAVRKARRDRALQKGRASESNRLSLYDDRMMFGNSL